MHAKYNKIVKYIKIYHAIAGIVRRNIQGGGYGLAMFSVAVVGLMANIVSVRMLSPYQMGVIQTVLLVPTYLVILGAGLYQGITNKVAVELSSKKSDAIDKIINVGYFGAYCISMIGCAASLLVIFIFLYKGLSLEYFWCLPIILFSLILEPISQFYDAVLLGLNNYKKSAKISILQAVVTGLGVAFIFWFGFYGAIFWRCLHVFSRWFVRVIDGGLVKKATLDFKILFSLVKTGFPVIIANTINNFYLVADRSISSVFLDENAVGQLTLSYTISTIGNMFYQVFATWVFSKASRLYGIGSSVSEQKAMFCKVVVFGFIMILPVSIIIVYGLGLFVDWFGVEYLQGLNAAKLTGLFLFTGGYSSFMVFGMLGDRRHQIIFTQVVALIFLWILGWWSCMLGYGFFGVVLSKVIVSLFLYVYVGFSVLKTFSVERRGLSNSD